MRIRHDIPGFREVFHHKRGGRIGRTNLWRCQQCGCFNDIGKTALSRDGDGLVTREAATASDDFPNYDYAKDTSAKSGCRFCGSLNWVNSKPQKLPDSKNLPATGWKRKRR